MSTQDDGAMSTLLTVYRAKLTAAEAEYAHERKVLYRQAVEAEDKLTAAEQRAEKAEQRAEKAEAEQSRLQKMLDVCSVVHGHNVKLKTELAAAEACALAAAEAVIERGRK